MAGRRQSRDTRRGGVLAVFLDQRPGARLSHAAEAGSRLAEAGRVSAALKLAVIYLDDLGGQAADFLIGLLGQFTSKYKSDPEIGLVGEYDFRSVFKYLNQDADPRRSAELGHLEWEFLAVLGTEPPIGPVYEVLAADPGFFVKVTEVAWRASDEKGDEDYGQDDDTAPEEEPLTEEQLQQAENAYMLCKTVSDHHARVGWDAGVTGCRAGVETGSW